MSIVCEHSKWMRLTLAPLVAVFAARSVPTAPRLPRADPYVAPAPPPDPTGAGVAVTVLDLIPYELRNGGPPARGRLLPSLKVAVAAGVRRRVADDACDPRRRRRRGRAYGRPEGRRLRRRRGWVVQQPTHLALEMQPVALARDERHDARDGGRGGGGGPARPLGVCAVPAAEGRVAGAGRKRGSRRQVARVTGAAELYLELAIALGGLRWYGVEGGSQ